MQEMLRTDIKTEEKCEIGVVHYEVSERQNGGGVLPAEMEAGAGLQHVNTPWAKVQQQNRSV